MQTAQQSAVYSYPEAQQSRFSAMPGVSLRHLYHWEKGLHWWTALSVGGFYGWHVHFGNIALPTSSKDLVTAVVTVVGVVLAFLATSQGFLFSMQDSAIIKRLKQLGSYETLLGYFTRSINYCLLALVYSLCLYFAEFGNSKDVHLKIIFTVWLAVCVLTLGSCCRIIWLFQGLLRRQ